MGIGVNVAPSDDAKVDIIDLDDGKTKTTISIDGTYAHELLRDVQKGTEPNSPEVNFERTVGSGPAGLKIVGTFDENTGTKDFSVSGSVLGVGVSIQFKLDSDNNVISSSGFGGGQLIAGQKYVVFGVPIGVDGIVSCPPKFGH